MTFQNVKLQCYSTKQTFRKLVKLRRACKNLVTRVLVPQDEGLTNSKISKLSILVKPAFQIHLRRSIVRPSIVYHPSIYRPSVPLSSVHLSSTTRSFIVRPSIVYHPSLYRPSIYLSSVSTIRPSIVQLYSKG